MLLKQSGGGERVAKIVDCMNTRLKKPLACSPSTILSDGGREEVPGCTYTGLAYLRNCAAVVQLLCTVRLHLFKYQYHPCHPKQIRTCTMGPSRTKSARNLVTSLEKSRMSRMRARLKLICVLLSSSARLSAWHEHTRPFIVGLCCCCFGRAWVRVAKASSWGIYTEVDVSMFPVYVHHPRWWTNALLKLVVVCVREGLRCRQKNAWRYGVGKRWFPRSTSTASL